MFYVAFTVFRCSLRIIASPRLLLSISALLPVPRDVDGVTAADPLAVAASFSFGRIDLCMNAYGLPLRLLKVGFDQALYRCPGATW
jgi:hypothetical protein